MIGHPIDPFAQRGLEMLRPAELLALLLGMVAVSGGCAGLPWTSTPPPVSLPVSQATSQATPPTTPPTTGTPIPPPEQGLVAAVPATSTYDSRAWVAHSSAGREAIRGARTADAEKSYLAALTATLGLPAHDTRVRTTVDNLMSMSENTAASRSRIVDADFAAESAKLAKSQVLQKAGTAMLSQANASTQDILSLLK